MRTIKLFYQGEIHAIRSNHMDHKSTEEVVAWEGRRMVEDNELPNKNYQYTCLVDDAQLYNFHYINEHSYKCWKQER